ncbi:bacillithiol biosynthesis deacetylase BshB2 [Oceanobacillus arenosus]|uniref:Bacillithiol biosynthesis deacetylase BshB2 n=1 Tax=Oceanobacillus arenosus TaxID=1229153 RepID=A0A3D8PKE3_9BACI|nr:bacillithiol biosynthesis deacetylase BshB2 [Oceanobacillus arenosus]RDW16540.1 bacillithiol biosynthesis deacetylase BshB2 [Oceanobacillus arenosus]
METHVVVIYPHPDDEAFGAAGTIAKFRDEGIPVTYLCGTLGEMGRNMGTPTYANRESLPAIRKKELIKACEVLDIELEMLGYRDKTIEFEDRMEIAARLKGYLDKLKPSLVITHYPEYAVHPDHNAFGAAAIEAVSLMEAEDRPAIWAQAFSNDHLEALGMPDIINDITPFFDKKMEAILAHDSQAMVSLTQQRPNEDPNLDEKERAKLRLGIEQFYTL